MWEASRKATAEMMNSRLAVSNCMTACAEKEEYTRTNKSLCDVADASLRTHQRMLEDMNMAVAHEAKQLATAKNTIVMSGVQLVVSYSNNLLWHIRTLIEIMCAPTLAPIT